MADDTSDFVFPKPPGMFGLPENTGFNDSERHLTNLCRRSFLRLWAYTNLFNDERQHGSRRGSKEMCDALVVFGDDVLIFSDKHITFQDHRELSVAWPRWYRSAIKESINQLWGAKRWISQHPDRVFFDASCTRKLPVTIPDATRARYHLIAVTRGTREAAKKHFSDDIGSLMTSTDVSADNFKSWPFAVGRADASRGFIHIFDEAALDIVMDELDTVADFVGYLERRAVLLNNPSMRVFAPGEEQLVAAYLTTMDDRDEHCFARFDTADPPGQLIFDTSHYAGLQRNPAYLAKKRSDRASRVWDELIDRFVTHGDPSANPDGLPAQPQEVERALRYMAGESRFRRRILADLVKQALRLARQGTLHARLYGQAEQPDPAYVIVVAGKADDETYDQYRNRRRLTLQAYCQVAKLSLPASNVFVGIAFDHPDKNYPGSSEDLLVWEQLTWDEQIKREREQMRAELDILGSRRTMSLLTAQEFPQAPSKNSRRPDLKTMFPGYASGYDAPRGKRPVEKKTRDKMKAKSQRRNRPKK